MWLGGQLVSRQGQPTTVLFGSHGLTVLGELFCGEDEGAWEHTSTNKGYVLCPGIDGLAVLGELFRGDDTGIHLPLPTQD